MDDRLTIEAIAANLQRLLAAKGWSQVDLARRSGGAEMTVSRIVRGQNMPGAGILGRMAAALGVSVDDLYVPQPKPAKKTSKKTRQSA